MELTAGLSRNLVGLWRGLEKTFPSHPHAIHHQVWLTLLPAHCSDLSILSISSALVWSASALTWAMAQLATTLLPLTLSSLMGSPHCSTLVIFLTYKSNYFTSQIKITQWLPASHMIQLKGFRMAYKSPQSCPRLPVKLISLCPLL